MKQLEKSRMTPALTMFASFLLEGEEIKLEREERKLSCLVDGTGY